MLKAIGLIEKNRVKVEHSKPIELCHQRSNKIIATHFKNSSTVKSPLAFVFRFTVQTS